MLIADSANMMMSGAPTIGSTELFAPPPTSDSDFYFSKPTLMDFNQPTSIMPHLQHPSAPYPGLRPTGYPSPGHHVQDSMFTTPTSVSRQFPSYPFSPSSYTPQLLTNYPAASLPSTNTPSSREGKLSTV